MAIGMGVNSSQDCDPRVLSGGIKQSSIRRGLGDMGLEACFQVKAVYEIQRWAMFKMEPRNAGRQPLGHKHVHNYAAQGPVTSH